MLLWLAKSFGNRDGIEKPRPHGGAVGNADEVFEAQDKRPGFVE